MSFLTLRAGFWQHLIFDGTVNDNLRDTEGAQFLDAFLDCQIFLGPTSLQFLNEAMGQHDHQSMAPGAGFESNMHRPHFQLHRFTRAKVLFDQRQIFGVASASVCRSKISAWRVMEVFKAKRLDASEGH